MQVVHNQERHRFEIELGDGLAVAEYNRLTHALMFTHTEVPPAHEGQGIATRLIEAGLAAAKAENLKVIPACAAFAHYFRKHPEARDLLEPSYVSVLGLDKA